MDDLPYEPVDRDRYKERDRTEKLPGYTQERKKAASELSRQKLETN